MADCILGDGIPVDFRVQLVFIEAFDDKINLPDLRVRFSIVPFINSKDPSCHAVPAIVIWLGNGKLKRMAIAIMTVR
jgi:hypothetical protein